MAGGPRKWLLGALALGLAVDFNIEMRLSCRRELHARGQMDLYNVPSLHNLAPPPRTIALVKWSESSRCVQRRMLTSETHPAQLQNDIRMCK